MKQNKGILSKAIKNAKDLQTKRDLVLLRFGCYMFIYSLIIVFTFIFISFIGGLFIWKRNTFLYYSYLYYY